MARKEDGSPDFDLIIEPNEVVMHRSVKGEETLITLRNPVAFAVLFKVKCLDNRRFRIRPSMGCLDANGSETVKIVRTQFDVPPPKLDCVGTFWAFPTAPDMRVTEQWQMRPPATECRRKIKWED